MNHLLIDFENIQPINLDKLHDENTHIWLFLGAGQQKHIPLELCQSLCRFGKNVHFVRVKKVGKNALDFYLSFYLGKITAQDPNALIGILSKDGGYDVLTEHIENNHFAQAIVRLASLDEIQSLPNSTQPAPVQLTEKQPAILQTESVETAEAAPTQSKYSSQDLGTVLNALRQPDAFLPRLYNNLVNRIQNIILADKWANYTPELRQKNAELIAEAMLRKRLITQEADDLIHYNISAEFVLSRIQEQALISKASTVEKLGNVIRSSLSGYGIESSAADIQQFIDNLIKKNLIKIQNNKVVYPHSKQPAQQSPQIFNPYKPENAVWQKVIHLLNQANRPNKLSGLRNLLKSQEKGLKLQDGESEQLIAYLQIKKRIKIQNDKINYL